MSVFPAAFNGGGREGCPGCGSEFVEIVEQGTSSSRPAGSAGADSVQSTARNVQQGDAGVSTSGAGGSRAGGTARAPRIEVHAMFHSSPGSENDMPLTFVDAISRFAPLSLPNGRQAFVLQVQDGALLSPFTMGIPLGLMKMVGPFPVPLPGVGDALAMNPGDWVVGDDLDAVVTRVLDAYMPPRRATAPEVRDTLPRRRAAARAALAASAASFSRRHMAATSVPSSPAAVAAAPAVSGPTATLPAGPLAAVTPGGEPPGGRNGETQLERPLQQSGQQRGRVVVRLEPLELDDVARVAVAGPAVAAETRGDGCSGGVRLHMVYEEDVAEAAAPSEGTEVALEAAGSSPPPPSAPPSGRSGAAAAAASDEAAGSAATACVAAVAAEDRGGGGGYASCQPGELCTVCHDAFEAGGEVVELPCRHCFHEDCIMPWLQEQNTCPVCRTRLGEGHAGSGISSYYSGGRPQQQAATSTHRPQPQSASSSDGRGPQTREERPAPRGGIPGAPAAAAGANFPLLNAFMPNAPGQTAGTDAGVLSAEERRVAEAVLEPLRTRFAPLQLTNRPPVSMPLAAGPAAVAQPPPGLLSMFGNAAMLPLFGERAAAAAAAAAATRGSQARTGAAGGGGGGGGTGTSRHQGNGTSATATPLRGGFLNNQLLNLYGAVSSGTRVAAGPRTGGGDSGSGGTRSALRGGFFNNGGGAAATAASSSTAATAPPQPPPQRPPRSGLGTSAPLSAAQPLPTARAATTAAAGTATPPQQPQPQPSPAATATADGRLMSGDVSDGIDMVAALSNPDLGSEAVLRQLERTLAARDRAGWPRPNEAVLRSLQRHAMMAATRLVHTVPFGTPDPGLMRRVAALADRWLRQAVALQQDAATLAHQHRTRRDNDNGDGASGGSASSRAATSLKEESEAANPASGPTDTGLDPLGSQPAAGSPASDAGAPLGAGDGNGGGDGAGVRSTTRVRVARRGRVVVASPRRGPSMASTTTASAALAAVRPAGSSGAQRRSASLTRSAGAPAGGEGSGGAGGGTGTQGARSVSTSPGAAVAGSAEGSHHGGGGGGSNGAGFNPLAAVVGGAGVGLRFLGGVAGGFLFRRGRGNGR
ncbi:hypothetical protein VOLCADRAFT_100265 [Volvox carteri f. nagariensis]|uniref:RING-type domain-containing protein n=1 Tax=Volvox carteri f. nagariensis TaxID=3068 RepID=D8UJV3_VOLCA|nr:uncharacterized protein VOLCADRAFT_100265 [Volvox carteri f. nagariensis]EFJ40020.1 hypothetical protein VOLCADRAFT_100265 [Volvox carteri f. nagariensis]|eukprot:XP_002958940.1 hypothetical protein VOLCADRAFT_100265 [Volvox carteri f. nagariensis]